MVVTSQLVVHDRVSPQDNVTKEDPTKKVGPVFVIPTGPWQVQPSIPPCTYVDLRARACLCRAGQAPPPGPHRWLLLLWREQA